MRKQRTLFQKVYLALIGVLGTASMATLLWMNSFDPLPSLWMLFLVSCIVGTLDVAVVQLETATPDSPVFVSTGPGIFIFAVLVLGPYGLIPMVLGGAVARWITHRWHQPLGYYFNAVETSITYVVMTAVCLPIRSGFNIAAPQTAQWLSITGVLLVYPAITLLFMSLLTSVGSKQPIRDVVTSVFLPTAWVDIIPVSLGLLGGILFPIAPWMLLIVILPFILAHRALGAIARWLDAVRTLHEVNEQLEQRIAERTADLRRTETNREREVNDAVHDLGHELRTIEGALKKLYIEDRAKALVQPAQALLADMLLASQLRADALHLNPSAVDIAALLAEVAQQLRPLVQRAECSIHFDLPDTRLLAWCDGPRMSRVFKNILHNALIYTLEYRLHAAIAVELTADDTMIFCTIVDNGPGMTEENIKSLGAQFVRLKTGAERPDGVGIGLSFCARLLALSNGALTIRSAGLDAGTAVTIAIPRAFGIDDERVSNDDDRQFGAVSMERASD